MSAKKEEAVVLGEVLAEGPERAGLLEEIADLKPEADGVARRGFSGGFGIRSARVLALEGRRATISMRGFINSMVVELAPGVESDLIADAMHDGDQVLVEFCEGEEALVVGVLQTKRARELRLKAATVVIEGEEEVVLRSGKAALRIRSDGDVELVGSRVSAVSRGLFRIVGRMLRLN